MSRLLNFFLFCLLFASMTCFGQSSSTTLSQGISLIKDERFEEAIDILETDLSKHPLTAQAHYFYLIGLANFYLENYDSAMNNFEIALDLSTNPQLDNKIDEYVEKTIKAQQVQEALKRRHRLSYFLGAGYDTNILNLNPDSFASQNLSGALAIYGFRYKYLITRKEGYSIEPQLYLYDNYSFDSSLKSNSTLQSSDALNIGVDLATNFYLDIFSPSDELNLTPGYKLIYIPQNSTQRSLSFTSASLKLGLLLYPTSSYSLSPSIFGASEKSLLTYANPEDNQSGTRFEFRLENNFYLETRQRPYLHLLAEQNNAQGQNSSYTTWGGLAGFSLPMGADADFDFNLQLSEKKYSKRTPTRLDKTSQINVEYSYKISDAKLISLRYARSSIRSDNTLNDYQDHSVSVVFSDSYNF